jgi:predicted secreted Zn-dependent protease
LTGCPAERRGALRWMMMSMPRVNTRSVVVVLALLASPGLTACSSPSPAPPRQPAGVETSVSTRYYPVRGTTAAAIFTAIDANGLVDARGQRAAGMTAAEWKLTSGDVDARAVPCVFPSLTIMLNLVVTLPRHETLDALPADLQSRWERFAARVAAHEQRHVDIYVEGAKAMKVRLEGTRTAVSCADLEKAIDAECRAQQADIERAQTEFHTEDETTARGEREALQTRLDGTRAELEPVDTEIRRLDTELADLRRRVEGGRADLVAQHNTLVGRRHTLAEEHNRLIADANGLIDALNWARW